MIHSGIRLCFLFLVFFITGWDFKADRRYRTAIDRKKGWLLEGEVSCRNKIFEVRASRVFIPDRGGFAYLYGQVACTVRGVHINAGSGKLQRGGERFFLENGRFFWDEKGIMALFRQIRVTAAGLSVDLINPLRLPHLSLSGTLEISAEGNGCVRNGNRIVVIKTRHPLYSVLMTAKYWGKWGSFLQFVLIGKQDGS